ncbi:MAG: hypothetical protein MUP28_07630, partial [Candidatus Aminicenantes bacterium]|nr:hypothetical protein [Candidatus Aminicenantes bacterium]
GGVPADDGSGISPLLSALSEQDGRFPGDLDQLLNEPDGELPARVEGMDFPFVEIAAQVIGDGKYKNLLYPSELNSCPWR